ncbi:RDD family protein [Flavobacterium lacus]|uniref:RDD family protein n=1 Tax=Flavobacterium lacus TaxID=1353778 RepID=A0A328WQK2_9FLAO|nr:RDD family protein [Flavobacterium lacus]RAR46647.1 RDD family protein [Flavobacterium lacus]
MYSIDSTTEVAQKRLRIIAFFIDYFIFTMLALILIVSFVGHVSIPIIFLLFLFLWPISEGLFGQTIGKRILSLKVVNNDLNKITMTQAIVRFIFAIIDLQMCLGILVALSDKNN